MTILYDSGLNIIPTSNISMTRTVKTNQIPTLTQTTFSQYATSETTIEIHTDINCDFWLKWRDAHSSNSQMLSGPNYKRDFFIEINNVIFYDLRGCFISELSLDDTIKGSELRMELHCDYFSLVKKPLCLIRENKIRDILS